MTLPPEMLGRSSAEGARTVALALLSDARAAAARARSVSDEEALHDFRVAVRRLRSTLRAWRSELGGSLRKKDLRRLRKLARSTSAARDREVLAGWVREARGAIHERHREAADWLSSHLDRRRAHDHGHDVNWSTRAFLRRAPGLARRLSRGGLPEAGAEPFGQALAGRIRDQAAAVRKALSRASSPPDPARAHRARIEGKRLRYLLEPFREVPRLHATEAVNALRRMQDRLGDLNDTRMAVEEIEAARTEAARKRAGRRGMPVRESALRALGQVARSRQARLLAAARREYLDDHGASVLHRAVVVAEALEARPPIAP